jgi:hypothetical protein
MIMMITRIDRYHARVRLFLDERGAYSGNAPANMLKMIKMIIL